MRKTNRKWVTIIVTLSLLFITTSDAYGMSFWDKLARHLIKEHKIHEKKVEKVNQYQKKVRLKELELEIKKEENRFNEQFRKEVNNKFDKPPLQRTYIQKIDVYEQEIAKVKSPKDLDKIINHIRKYGVEKYGDNLSQQHKDLLKDLEKMKEKYKKDKDKDKDDNDGEKGGTGGGGSFGVDDTNLGKVIDISKKREEKSKSSPLATTGGVATGGAILYVAFRIFKAFTPLRFLPF